MPLTCASSSALWKAPCCLRQDTIAAALDGPMLTSESCRALASAVLMLTFCGVFFVERDEAWCAWLAEAEATTEALLTDLAAVAWAPPTSSSDRARDCRRAVRRFMVSSG